MADTDNDTPAAAAATPTPKVTASQYCLTIKNAFADYQIGQRVTDPNEVNQILAGENVANVLKTLA